MKFLRGELVVLALASLLWTGFGYAQAGDPIAASESLFREGRELMQAGRYDRACQAFEASLELDPALGTLLNLAKCYEADGKFASAWSRYRDAQALAHHTRDAARESTAAAAGARLEPMLTRLKVRVRGATSRTQARLDGAPIPLAALTLGIAINPGPHRLLIEEPGRIPLSREVSVDRTQTGEIDLVLGPLASLGPPPSSPAQPTEAPTEAVAPEASPRRGPASLTRPLALGLSLGGAALLGAGVALFVSAHVAIDGANCDAQQVCSTPEDVERVRAAQNLQYAGFVVGAAGVVSLGTGIFLYVMPRPGLARSDPPSGATWGVRGVF